MADSKVDSNSDPTMDTVSEAQPLLGNEPEVELKGCGNTAICNPHRRLHRYMILVFICLLSFGKSLPREDHVRHEI